ncbi:MAG: type II/IV secretion system protein [Deltaproteobacteria bacterium]|nr:type II/IV secretion system protein [Deltaproteobacteria bacterium]
MYRDVILELRDGRRESGILSHDFDPQVESLEIMTKHDGKRHNYNFSDVCCVKMIPDSNWILSSGHRWVNKCITTITGQQYVVYSLGEKKSDTGFFALNTNSNGDGDYKLIFFNYSAIDSRAPINVIENNQSENPGASPTLYKYLFKQQQRVASGRKDANEALSLPEDKSKGMFSSLYDDMQKFRVGQILVLADLITQTQLDETLEEQKNVRNKKIGKLLMEKKMITEEQLLKALAIKLRMKYVDLTRIIPDKCALDMIPGNIAKSLNVIPIEKDEARVIVATADPTDIRIEDLLRFYTRKRIEFVVATSKQITEGITHYYYEGNFGVKDLIDDITDTSLVSWEDEKEQQDQISESDSLIISLVNRILREAYLRGSSDIHFEPGMRKEPSQVRYRIDGVCSVAHHIPAVYKRALVSRIKILANLDISEHRRPQSGKIALRYGAEQVEFRVEVTPTAGGNEDVVLRVLRSSRLFQLEELGFSDYNLQTFKELVEKPYGMLLCVGPTGSGKTTTLHAALAHLNTPDRKIWTAEDPVEITQRGLRQVQVNPKVGYSFQEALRSFLRSDPDVIMIGEMRDSETANTAISAALTGHLMLSTLHTNNAPETITRLIEMDMNPLNFADSILGILAQRLTRKLCDHCKEAYHPEYEEYEKMIQIYGADPDSTNKLPVYSNDLVLMKKRGCERCEGTGYKGRITIHELLKTSPAMKQAIKKKNSIDEIRELAVAEGMKTLVMDGIEKVFAGLTDLEQVMKAVIK